MWTTRRALPPPYKCSGCAAHGVKLWRQYNTVASAIELKCVECLVRENNDEWTPKDASEVDADGRWEGKYQKGDQIAHHVPAVPDEEGYSFWGYTSVPQAGVDWWRRLPNRVEN